MGDDANRTGEPRLEPPEPGHHSGRVSGWLPITLLAVETALLTVTHWLHAPWGFWLAAHVLLIGALAAHGWQRREAGDDLSEFGLTVLAVLIGGPAGALLIALALPLWRRERAQPALLAAWYERIALSGDIDPVTRLADTVAMGRALLTTDKAPRPFADVMASGSLADRQTALGLIARRFSPAYAEALKAALVTGEPLVRVQAAAVAVKVRAELKTAVRSGIEQAGHCGAADGAGAAALSRTLREFVATGLLEDDDHAAADTAIARLVAIASDAAGPDAYDPATCEHLETELLRAGNYAGFRAIRVAGRVTSAGSAAVPAEAAHGG